MWEEHGDEGRAPPLAQLLIRSRPASSGGGPDVALDLVTTRRASFVLPAGDPRVAARTLLAYNRLRPRRVRATRRALATGLALGAGRHLTTPSPVAGGPGTEDVVAFLAAELGEPALLLAGSDVGGSGFRTPVLQLFTADGRPRGYAKIGWDPVTVAMVEVEADALERVRAARFSTLTAPAVAWFGTWHDLTVLVTEPMHPGVRRLNARELPPIDPLREIATLWGAPRRSVVTASTFWARATAVADRAAAAGRPALTATMAAYVDHHDGADVRFGAWHGDWVEWNLGRVGRGLVAWDWAYAAPDVPIGFDVLQFFHLRYRNLRGLPADVALTRAARDAVPGLRALGLDSEERAAVVALHRLEVALRDERARQLRTPRASAWELGA
jgi:hypothetical protein